MTDKEMSDLFYGAFRDEAERTQKWANSVIPGLAAVARRSREETLAQVRKVALTSDSPEEQKRLIEVLREISCLHPDSPDSPAESHRHGL